MAMTREQKRERRTEYRERLQLKIAREVVAGKRDGRGRTIVPAAPAIEVPANYTGRIMRNYVWLSFIDGREVPASEYRAYMEAE